MKHSEKEKTTLDSLSPKLKEKYDKGFDFSSLYKYVKFHQEFPEILDSLCPKSGRPLSWTHYRILLQETSPEARAWYAKEAQEQAWSVRTLQFRRNFIIYRKKTKKIKIFRIQVKTGVSHKKYDLRLFLCALRRTFLMGESP